MFERVPEEHFAPPGVLLAVLKEDIECDGR
jgi:hypothetical protein